MDASSVFAHIFSSVITAHFVLVELYSIFSHLLRYNRLVVSDLLPCKE